jgi:hypothetical protein
MKKNSNKRRMALDLPTVVTAILTMLLAASAAQAHGFGSGSHVSATRFNKARSMLTLKIDCAGRLSGGERSECKVGVLETHDDEIEIKLVSTNPGLLKLEVSEVKLLPNQSVAKIAITTSPTPIKTTVVINAHVNTNNLVHAAAAVEVVPALIASAQLSAGSFVGTHGTKTTCKVKLKAPAPPGGIQIYLSPLKVSPTPSNREPITIQGPTPTVPAGSTNVDVDLPYDALYQGYNQISQFDSSIVGFTNEFDEQTRTVELIVALEPQGTKPQWVAIPGIANKVSFEVVPLRITSLSVQPSTLNGGEALATFSLSAPPGNSEFVLLRPVKTGPSSKLWATPLGVSCAATPTNVSGNSNQLQLVQGTSTYQFKVCSGTVSTAFTGQVTVYIRSGDADAPVTVQP